MKIVYIGAVQFSKILLEILIKSRADIVGVCTLKKSNFNTDHVDLTGICNNYKIPCIYTKEINNDEIYNWIKDLEPDIIFCFGWSRLLCNKLLNMPPIGVVGYHPAALPSNRGRHPLIWALALGLDETASTFFFMTETADSGEILSQEKIIITNKDNAESLYKKMTIVASNQIVELLPKFESGLYESTKQDHTKANYWRKRNQLDGKIDWRMSAKSIHNLVRSLSKPYVGAHLEYDGKIIRVWKTKIISNKINNIEPGKIISVGKNNIVIKAGNDSISLVNIDPKVEFKVGKYL